MQFWRLNDLSPELPSAARIGRCSCVHGHIGRDGTLFCQTVSEVRDVTGRPRFGYRTDRMSLLLIAFLHAAEIPCDVLLLVFRVFVGQRTAACDVIP